MLCGISTRFHVLFPTDRQVAHALLTRPPLTFNKSKLPYQFVRLECVRHAASVHPEPGSNSQNILSNVSLPEYFKPYFELSAFALLLFPWVVVLLLLFGINELFFVLLVFRCSIFKVRAAALAVSFIRIPQTSEFVKYFFSFF